MEAEGIELRDFALEAADHHAALQADRQHLKHRRLQGSKLARFWNSHIRILIEETASRDHLALERTYLAYVRTSTAFAQLGVTIAQLFRLNVGPDNALYTPTTLRIGKALGATTEAIAIIVLLLGAAYFAKQQMAIISGKAIARGYQIPIMILLSLALFGIILGLLAAADKW